MNKNLKKIISKYRKIVDNEINKYISSDNTSSDVLRKAIRYAVFSGGKRLRPILVIASSKACGGNIQHALPWAVAVEMIHAYSLVHDDLPAMDNDDLRRGKPTTHKKFGEAMAILAGDALLTKPFEILSKNDKIIKLYPRAYLNLINILSTAAGAQGMVGGQALDLSHERNGSRRTLRQLLKIHSGKTGALITACTKAGAVCAGTSRRKVERLTAYGQAFGLAFQVMDDVLDVIGDKKKLGKKGSDRDNNKLTFPSLWGVEKSIAFAKKKIKESISFLNIFGKEADPLRWLAEYVVERDS